MNGQQLGFTISPAKSSGDVFQKLLCRLKQLDEHKIPYQLARFREETVAVLITVPGERWEIEYFQDGTVEIERFCSDGKILTDETVLDQLIQVNSKSE